jgi:uncharacterized membrane protein YdbT with pleckstrin-like domain
MKLTNKLKKGAKKRIFGRWLEDLAIGIFAGVTISFTLGNWLYWYWLIVVSILLLWGTSLQLKKEDFER